MKCTNCKFENNAEAKFCIKCGTPLQKKNGKTPEQIKARTQKTKKALLLTSGISVSVVLVYFLFNLLLIPAYYSIFIRKAPTGSIKYQNKTYKTIVIGKQEWMAENLAATKYANGTKIPHITSDDAWAKLKDNNTDKAYCFNDNDESLGYGALYTYAAATNGDNSGNKVQGVCPKGWHLPSDAEWTQLENYLADNGYNYDGSTGGGRDKIAKALGSHKGWDKSSEKGDIGNNPKINNKSGFSALPGGNRGCRTGKFYTAGYGGYWWSSTQIDSNYACYRTLVYDYSYVGRYYDYKSSGFSVRCLRD